MTISVEHLTSLVRFHPVGGYGDPFDLTCVIRWASPTTVLISGLAGEGMSVRYARELGDWLRAQGVREVVMTRRGQRRVITI